MQTIRPSADLRNNYNQISEFCHKHEESVFITKNGKGDLTVLRTKSSLKSLNLGTMTLVVVPFSSASF